MRGLELDFVVEDTLLAINLYEKIFDVEIIEKTNLSRGQNEVIFSICNTRLHILDENQEFGLKAPDKDIVQSMWFNVMVENISKTHTKAIKLGFIEIQNINKFESMGISNSIIKDPFGYIWMLHSTNKE